MSHLPDWTRMETRERDRLLTEYWSQGLTAGKIAAMFANATRSAVIGRVHRMKLPARGRGTGCPKRMSTPARKPASQAPTRIGLSASSPAAKLGPHLHAGNIARKKESRNFDPGFVDTTIQFAPPSSRRLALLELTDRTCKWPNGDPLAEGFSFCGNDAGASGPYCTFHSRLAYEPASDGKRLR